jgi:hypothetical protein
LQIGFKRAEEDAMATTDLTAIGVRSLILLGCGKMGGALLEGWLKGGLSPAQIHGWL